MSTPLQIAPVSYFQPTRPTEVVVDDSILKRIRKLESIFKSAVNKAIAAVKFPPPSMENNTAEEVLEDVPITIGEPNEHDSNVVIPCSLTPKKPKLKSSSVVDTQNITFELPQPCLVDHIDMDKLPSFDKENNLIVAPRRKLSYIERLNGWSVELRQRDKNDKREKFYHHPHSTRVFRSVKEVVKFILYEEYPRKYTKKDKQMMLIEDKGSDMTTNEQRKKRLCMPTSSSVDESLVQEITRKVVEKPHKDDNPNIAKNVIELTSQRSMPKQVVHMYQSYSQQLAHAWQKQMIDNYHQSLFYKISSAKLPPGTKATDNAFQQAQALPIIPISVYKPNERFAHIIATPNRVVHGTTKMAKSVMVEDMPNKAEAPTTERTCMPTSNDCMGEKGKGKMALEEF